MPGVITYSAHEDHPEWGMRCLICSYKEPGWFIGTGLPGMVVTCEKCGHYLGDKEQLRFNQWVAMVRTGAHIQDLTLRGIENYALTTAGFLEAERLMVLINMVKDMQIEREIIEAANRRLNEFMSEKHDNIRRLTDRLKERMQMAENREGR